MSNVYCVHKVHVAISQYTLHYISVLSNDFFKVLATASTCIMMIWIYMKCALSIYYSRILVL